jgi:cell division protease FtsH
MKISDAEKRATAIHEAGHAIAARFTPGADPVHKITIIPRGRSLGQTAFLPAEEKHSRMKSELKAALVGLLGGLAAEKIGIGETGTGVGNDLQRVTSMARRMVCEFGMSERLGPRTFGDTRSTVFVGRDMGGGNENGRDYGEDVAQIIDEEVQGLVQWALDQAMGILTEHRDLLDRLTNALVERESIDAEEFEMIIAGKELPVLFKPGEGKPPNPDSGPGKEDARDRKPKTPPRLSDFLDSPSGAPG